MQCTCFLVQRSAAVKSVNIRHSNISSGEGEEQTGVDGQTSPSGRTSATTQATLCFLARLTALITFWRPLPVNRNHVLLIQIFHRPLIGVRTRHWTPPRPSPSRQSLP